jgi:hypothetical protein
MGAPSREGVALRAEVERAVLAAAEKLGVEAGIDTAAIVRHFSGRGAADSTLFRWCREIIKSGKPGQHVARQVKRAAERRERKAADPAAAAASVAAEVAEKLPVVVSVDDVIGSSSGRKVVTVIERLQTLAADLELLVKHAKNPDGGVRNARLLLQATGEFRKLLETGARIHAAMREADQVDRLHDAILDEIGKCDADLHVRVLLRLQDVAAAWGG